MFHPDRLQFIDQSSSFMSRLPVGGTIGFGRAQFRHPCVLLSYPVFKFISKRHDRASSTRRNAPHRKSQLFPPPGAPRGTMQIFSDFFPPVQNFHWLAPGTLSPTKFCPLLSLYPWRKIGYYCWDWSVITVTAFATSYT